MKHALATTLAALPLWASAHDGHGIASVSHWHPTDASGWVVVAALMAVALWLSRRS